MPLPAALRALVVSACALSSTALAHPRGGYRVPPAAPFTGSHPYLALAHPNPLRFAPPERPPVELPLPPLPEDESPSTRPGQTGDPASAPNGATVVSPGDEQLDPEAIAAAAAVNEAKEAVAAAEAAAGISSAPSDNPADETMIEKETYRGPPPIMLIDELTPSARPEDVLPFFRLPTAPSRATYRQE